ncbi:MAG: hypothetical protein ACI9UQ_000278 [Candidatus Krumholzibacteriia bacterium]|jgi:hypothetical protein
MLIGGAGVRRQNVSNGISFFVCSTASLSFTTASLFFTIALCAITIALDFAVQGFSVPAAIAQSSAEAQAVEPVPETPRTPETSNLPRTPARRELQAEVRNYRELIATLRDSLEFEESNGLGLSSDQRERLEGNISEISDVISQISEELAELEFEIKDNRLSLVNEEGEGIVINLPEDLDEQMSQGIQAITQLILAETDSIDFDHAKDWDWNRFRPKPPEAPQRVINGNIIKIWDDVEISDTEDVRGQVVVIFGNAKVDGRVDGNVVTVFGNLLLSEDSEVSGTAVAAGGYLDQAPGAEVGDVVSVDFLRIGKGNGWQKFGLLDGWSFAITQAGFLLTLVLGIIAVMILPQQRLERIVATLQESPLPSLGVGTLGAIGGHFAIAIILVVLVLTVIGVPIALLVALGLLIVVLAAIVTCSAAVGQFIWRTLTGESRSLLLAVAVGMIVLHLPSFIGSLLAVTSNASAAASVFSIIGVLIKTIAYLLGLGAIIISRFGLKSSSS